MAGSDQLGLQAASDEKQTRLDTEWAGEYEEEHEECEEQGEEQLEGAQGQYQGQDTQGESHGRLCSISASYIFQNSLFF